ncbi:hypothetical protein PVAND_014889 [Polypedilum vanderplanki]|uniref:Uncharacterized protein n=1 Tax=Polypedilum vanderplanki TaxID=319348 RepID=A0A9J6BB15_POLVA|nr:hypothetical protein PVAND_014889 [Polypedilum vanderplanki]
MELKKCEEPLTKDVCLANRTSLSLPPQFSPTNLDEIKIVENKFPYDIEETKKSYRKFCELSKDEKEIIFKSKVLFQGTTVIFGVLINNNEKLCERLSPEQIDEMLNGEVVSFFNPLKQPSKEYREKKFKKNIDDSDDYFSKVNNGGKNQDNNDTLRSSGGGKYYFYNMFSRVNKSCKNYCRY